MATLTVKCRRGDATVEVPPGEAPADTAARIELAVQAAGGRVGERAPRPKLMTVEQRRHQQMSALGLLECESCGTWVPATQGAAVHHQRKCTAKAA